MCGSRRPAGFERRVPASGWTGAAQFLVVLVASLDEAALRLEGGHILMGELAAELVERGPGGVEALDETLVDGQPLAVALVPVGGGNPLVALDQLGQMLAHQPPRILRERVEQLGLAEAAFEQGKL